MLAMEMQSKMRGGLGGRARNESYREWRTLARKTLSARSAVLQFTNEPSWGCTTQRALLLLSLCLPSDRQFTMTVLGSRRHEFFGAGGKGEAGEATETGKTRGVEM
ncbi:hypothetical protein KM043_013240 [Ampulex compressa]|nr:hypothetical protein KM043_013240 [Ampulex compressa]